MSGKYEGRFWQQSYGGEEQHQQETNGEVSVVFSNGNTYSKSSFKFNNNAGNLGSKKSSSSSFGRADQAGRRQLATGRTQGAHSCILFIQMELCSSTLRYCATFKESASPYTILNTQAVARREESKFRWRRGKTLFSYLQTAPASHCLPTQPGHNSPRHKAQECFCKLKAGGEIGRFWTG